MNIILGIIALTNLILVALMLIADKIKPRVDKQGKSPRIDVICDLILDDYADYIFWYMAISLIILSVAGLGNLFWAIM